MSTILQSARVVRYAAANGIADLRAIYTWRSWLFGWLGRMLAQVTFFTVLGRVVGGPDDVRFLVIGNAMMTCAIEALMVIASTTWERAEGTMALLVAAPVNLTWVFVGRSVQWLISGVGTSTIALLVLGPPFGVQWSVADVPVLLLLVLLTAFTTYSFGLFLAALALNASSVRNIVSNVTYLLMMAICGVQVPRTYWPQAVQWVADCIPLTYCIEAVRRLADGATATAIIGPALGGLVLGGVWLGAAWLAFTRLATSGRRAGTIDFAT